MLRNCSPAHARRALQDLRGEQLEDGEAEGAAAGVGVQEHADGEDEGEEKQGGRGASRRKSR